MSSVIEVLVKRIYQLSVALPLLFTIFSGVSCQRSTKDAELNENKKENFPSNEKDNLSGNKILKDTDIEKTSVLLDTALFDKLNKALSRNDSSGKWPVKAAYPKEGAIFPFKRVVAFYGNFYSKRMGILGELPEDQMLSKLNNEVSKWQQADSSITVQPAIHYIAVTAQASPGSGAKYRLRMPSSQIDKAVEIAKKINGLVFLDVQVGRSTVQEEIPMLEKYLSMPEVHLGIDPEFSMKSGAAPGKEIGTFDAADINYTQKYLANLVNKLDLPPKILVVHRFTQHMITNYRSIEHLPEVQLVIDMDGWGNPAKKKNTYQRFVYAEPIHFAGFKIFYKNDSYRVGEKREMQPQDVLKLTPQPVYIQYQ